MLITWTPCARLSEYSPRPLGRLPLLDPLPQQPGTGPHRDLPATLGGAAFAPADWGCVFSVVDKHMIHSSVKWLGGHEKQGHVISENATEIEGLPRGRGRLS